MYINFGTYINFKETVGSMRTCGLEPDATLHLLLLCYLYSTQRQELFNNEYIANPP